MKDKPNELYIRDMIWGGVWGALALFLPLLFHPFGLAALLMPLFLPLLIAGCTLHLRVSLVLALSIPLISSLFTGMPPLYPPVALLMVLEGLGMNLWLFLVYQKGRVNIYLSLAGAFLVQRAVRVIVILLAREVTPLPASWLLIPALLWGLPGAIIQVGIIPWIVKTINTRAFGVSAGAIGEEDSHRITG